MALMCPHGMPSRASCVTCMEDGPVSTPATWARVGAIFPARYDGTCPGCDKVIWPPDLVQRWDKGDGRLVIATIYTHPECSPS